MGDARIVRGTQDGAALVMLVVVLVPVVTLFGGFALAMHARDLRLDEDIARERCFWIAEGGIDDAIHRASAGLLPAIGMLYELDLGGGATCTVNAIALGGNGIDDDGDGMVDEADEDLLEVHSIGRYRRWQRELVTWLGRVPFLPDLGAPAVVASPSTDVDLGGTPRLDGRDHDLDGSPGDPAEARAGLAIMTPGTVADLAARLTGGEPDAVLGAGGTPSLAQVPSFDVVELAARVRNVANLVLTNTTYADLQFGNAETGTGLVTFREGDLHLTGNSRGAGILVVTGDLVMSGTCRFDGVILVLGSLENAGGTAQVYGAVVLGPGAGSLRAAGTFDLRYSVAATRFADGLVGRYATFNGWQELAR